MRNTRSNILSEGPLSERSVYCSLKFALNDAVCLSWGDVFSSIKIKYTLSHLRTCQNKQASFNYCGNQQWDKD